MNERAFLEGKRRVFIEMLETALVGLGIDDPEAKKAEWVLERQEIIAFLRDACAAYGDNDWPDELHLVDVLEKHLMPRVYDDLAMNDGYQDDDEGR
jgi:hypothetical protein